MSLFDFFLLLPPVESVSGAFLRIKWFQPPLIAVAGNLFEI
jgi:hypothetical protein